MWIEKWENATEPVRTFLEFSLLGLSIENETGSEKDCEQRHRRKVIKTEGIWRVNQKRIFLESSGYDIDIEVEA